MLFGENYVKRYFYFHKKTIIIERNIKKGGVIVKIRQAIIEDAFGIAQVHIASWKSTYRGIIADEILNELRLEQRISQWQQHIENPYKTIIVLENNNGIIGFADGQKVEDDVYMHYEADMTCLYLYAEQQRQGYGRQLVGELFEKFKQQGMTSCIVKVLTGNSSHLFYEKLGAKKIDSFHATEYGEGNTMDVYAWDKI